MVDDLKNVSDSLRKLIFSGIKDLKWRERDNGESDSARNDNTRVKELLATFLSWAGKSKDDAVQILCREFGWALASMLKEPLQHLAEEKRLKITIELVGKDQKSYIKSSKNSKPKGSRVSSTPRRRHKKAP